MKKMLQKEFNRQISAGLQDIKKMFKAKQTSV